MQSRSKRKKTYNPKNKYVFVQPGKPVFVPKSYTPNQIIAGLESGEIITFEAYKQRRFVHELNGKFVTENELANPKKRAKLEANGKIVSATAFRNRTSQLRNKGLVKITNYDEALEAAVKLTPNLPSLDAASNNHFETDQNIMKQLMVLPRTLWNKMGIISIKAKRNSQIYRVKINQDKYLQWHENITSAPLSSTANVPAITPEPVIELPQQANTTTAFANNTPLGSFSLFAGYSAPQSNPPLQAANLASPILPVDDLSFADNLETPNFLSSLMEDISTEELETLFPASATSSYYESFFSNSTANEAPTAENSIEECHQYFFVK